MHSLLERWNISGTVVRRGSVFSKTFVLDFRLQFFLESEFETVIFDC